jgi:hypothetical protein
MRKLYTADRSGAFRSGQQIVHLPVRIAEAELRVLELTPDEGESIRRLKLLVARAANEINRLVGYGQTDEGTLVVWLVESHPQRRRWRRRSTTLT